MKTLLQNILCLALASIYLPLAAQTTLYYETFDSATTTSWSLNTSDLSSQTNNQNPWLINNAYKGADTFVNEDGGGFAVIITTPNEPAGISGYPQSHYMHISNGPYCGVYNANFLAPASGNVFAKMNTPIVTSGNTDVTLTFWYLSNGNCPDNYYGLLFYSIDGGTTWIQEGTKYYDVKTWTQATVSDPAFNNQADLRFAFQWVQNGFCGAVQDPPLSVDEIKVTGNSCPVSITGEVGFNPCGDSSNGGISITATGDSFLIYLINDGIVADTNANGSFPHLGPGTYAVKVTNGTCWQTGTSVTLTNPGTATASNNGPICSGTNLTLSATAVTGATYVWTGPNSFSDTSANVIIPAATVSDSGTYTLNVSIPGCSTISSFTDVVIDSCAAPSDTVWPGDANADGIADYLDLLYLGMAYGDRGPTRAEATNDWTGQNCLLWTNNFPGGIVNHNNADCNGDGVVDANDTVAILQNYSLTHSKSAVQQRSPGSPLLSLQLINNQVHTGDPVTVTINLGNNDLETQNIYGLAFRIIYDSSLVAPQSMATTFQSSWLGTIGSDVFTLAKNLPSSDELDMAIARNDHTTRTGAGIIGQVSFIANQLSGNTLATMPLFIDGLNAIDSVGNYIPLDTKNDTLTIQATTAGITNVNAGTHLMLYPNPAATTVFLSADKDVESYIIYNACGQEIANQENLKTMQCTVDVSSYPQGVYVMHANIGGQNITQRFTVLR